MVNPPARPGASGGPLRTVLAAFDSGAVTLADIASRTGLDRDVVEAAVHHLVRTGLLVGRTLSAGCPESGCGSCASGRSDGPGCASSAAATQRTGSVLVALSRRRADPPAVPRPR